MRIYTIGHSTHAFDAFAEILQSFGIQTLVDVRSYPGSRYVPQYNKETMANALKAYGIAYQHLLPLGGRRKSANPADYALVEGWRHKSFQNYAAYTLTAEYETGVNLLIETAAKQTLCILCAESLPWRCHRLIIANTLTSRGIEVFHIMGKNQAAAHRLNQYGAVAVEHGKTLIYPKE